MTILHIDTDSYPIHEINPPVHWVLLCAMRRLMEVNGHELRALDKHEMTIQEILECVTDSDEQLSFQIASVYAREVSEEKYDEDLTNKKEEILIMLYILSSALHKALGRWERTAPPEDLHRKWGAFDRGS